MGSEASVLKVRLPAVSTSPTEGYFLVIMEHRSVNAHHCQFRTAHLTGQSSREADDQRMCHQSLRDEGR